jgi:peptide deformylase
MQALVKTHRVAPLIPDDSTRLRIISYPDPILRRVCLEVGDFGEPLRRLAARMIELMHESKGVGLAAPQVGVPVRVFVCNPTGEPGDDTVFVNPKLENLSGAVEHEEGCLSIPEASVLMRRAKHTTITARNVEGEPFERSAEELLARIWQHENDHLNGRLIIDHMSDTDELANRRILKELRDKHRGARKR